MFTFLNKLIRKQMCGVFSPTGSRCSSKHRIKKTRSPRGQVAIVLIFIIAAGLVFYAVSLNVGRISAGKVTATKASNLAAARLASLMASYGEQVFQEQLDGKEEICGWTGVFQALLLVVIFVAIILTSGAVAGFLNVIAGTSLTGTQVAVAAAVAAVASGVSAVIQATVIEPGITEAWNKIIWENMTIVDQFMEQGIQTGLKNAVSDQVELPDIVDLDGDGKFGDLADPDDPYSAPDYVSRFGWYYMERIKNTPPPPQLGEFAGCLCALLYVDDQEECCARLGYCYDSGNPAYNIPDYCRSPDWGLYDPLPCGARFDDWSGARECCPTFEARVGPNQPGNDGTQEAHDRFPAMCDPCCQPQYMPCHLKDLKDWVLCKCHCDPNEADCTCPKEEIEGVMVPVLCAPWAEACDDLEGQEDYTLDPSIGEPIPKAPECCYLPFGDPDKCGDPDTCLERSYLVYGPDIVAPNEDDYAYIYDKHYEDPDNNDIEEPLISLREDIGRDDMHPAYLVDWDNPNWQVDFQDPFGGGRQIYLPEIDVFNDAGQSFRHVFERTGADINPNLPQWLFTLRDTTGFYRPPLENYPPFDHSGQDECEEAGYFWYLNGCHSIPAIYTENPDRKRGIFSYFYKMGDWGIQLSELTYGDDTTQPQPWDNKDDYQCYWCDLINPDSPHRTRCLINPYSPPELHVDRIEEMYDHDRQFTITDPALFQTYAQDDLDWCVDRKQPDWLLNHSDGPHPSIVADHVSNFPDFRNKDETQHYVDGDGENYPFFNERPFVVDETCATERADGSNDRGWRRGLDWFCDTGTPNSPPLYPYQEGCLKNGGYHACDIEAILQDFTEEGMPTTRTASAQGDCRCENPGTGVGATAPLHDPEEFPEDNLDIMVAQMDDFIDWAEGFLYTPLRRLRQTFEVWYPEAADWVEPGCKPCEEEEPPGWPWWFPRPRRSGGCCGPTDGDEGCPDCYSDEKDKNCCCEPQNDTACPGSYTNKNRVGKLHQWRKTIKQFRDPIAEWLTMSHSDGETWCVPSGSHPRRECSAPDEYDTYDYEPLSPEGDVNDVIACLKWQAEDEMTINEFDPGCPPSLLQVTDRGGALVPIVGNALKFRACAQACARDRSSMSYTDWPICLNLPRSLHQDICIRTDEHSREPILTDEDDVDEFPGFHPPFDEEAWKDCLKIRDYYNPATATPPTTIDEVRAWLLACSTACSGLDYCRYEDYGAPSGFYVMIPNTQEQLDDWLARGWDVYGSCFDDDFYGALDTLIERLDDGLNDCALGSDFLDDLELSEEWAYAQMDKYKYRAWFLLNRANEAKKLYQIMDEAYFQLTNFLVGYNPRGDRTGDETDYDVFGRDNITGNDEDLENESVFGGDHEFAVNPQTNTYDDYWDSPTEQIIWQRHHIDKGEEQKLPSVAVYVWRDGLIPDYKKARSDGSREGYVHAVKVEARIPKRCNDACLARRWPYVATKSHTFERCYYLAADRGRVKARVIRFDEDPDVGIVPRFPGGAAIWKPRYHHPTNTPVGPGLLDPVFSICDLPDDPAYDPVIKILRNFSWHQQYHVSGAPISPFGHAFMLNHVPWREKTSDAYNVCWDTVHQRMLEKGVVSDTCAEYYYAKRGYGRRGFKMRFVDCDLEFSQGIN